jgi:hypothetical protein
MVAAWLISTKGLEVDEAIEFLRSKRPLVSPNEVSVVSVDSDAALTPGIGRDFERSCDCTANLFITDSG